MFFAAKKAFVPQSNAEEEGQDQLNMIEVHSDELNRSFNSDDDEDDSPPIRNDEPEQRLDLFADDIDQDMPQIQQQPQQLQ